MIRRMSILVALAIAVTTCNFIWKADEYTFDRPPGSCVEGVPPVDDRECTDDLCINGVPSHPAAPSGTPCEGGARVCDEFGECVAANCINGVLDADETDIDCGGSCVQCGNGLVCADAADCKSGVCTDLHCAYPTCIDAVENGDESDVDCGGEICDGCPDGGKCAASGDCASRVCSSGACQVPTCTDAVKNGGESDTDCGGGCTACLDGKACFGNQDCQSGVCALNQCVPLSCNDNTENGSETDVDCGGVECAPCPDGDGCMTGTDCINGICQGQQCKPASCTDNVFNGNETDVDCGGTCAACGVGKMCLGDDDCTTTVCVAGSCLLLNGCDPATAADLTAQSSVTVDFQGLSNTYEPPCIRIASGTTVTFVGNFNPHPLEGGKVIQAVTFPDPTSPFWPTTNTGNMKSFTLTSAGTFPYYCTYHAGGGHAGVVIVQ